MKIFGEEFGKEFFYEFWLKNSCKNGFKDNTEKSYSWSRNRVSHKIDFKAVWPRNGHADSVGVRIKMNHYIDIKIQHDKLQNFELKFL